MNDTAIVLYTKALELFIKIGDIRNENAVYMNLAMSYATQSIEEKDKDRRKNHETKALFYGEKAFENNNKFGRIKNKINVANILSVIYADFGKYDEAYKYTLILPILCTIKKS